MIGQKFVVVIFDEDHEADSVVGPFTLYDANMECRRVYEKMRRDEFEGQAQIKRLIDPDEGSDR